MSQVPDEYYVNLPSIIIDDSDPAIRYNGTWNIANETDIKKAVFRERVPMFNSLHIVPIFSNSSLSYSFIGKGISVFATPVDNSTYTSQCLLDGIPLIPSPRGLSAMFGQSRPVCAAFGLSSNTGHTISIIASVPPQDHQDLNALSGFAFDYMLIQPEDSLPLWGSGSQDIYIPILNMWGTHNSTETTPNFDLGFALGKDQIGSFARAWEYDPSNGFHTAKSDAQLNVTFIGTSLWWYGFTELYDSGRYDTSSATFTVDGGRPSTFSIPAAFAASVSQAFLFSTPVMQNGTHSVTVVYQNRDPTSSRTPFTLQSLIIQRSGPRASVPGPTTGSSPTPTMSIPPTSSPTSKHEKIGSIAGGIGGGLAFLLLVTAGMYALTGWKRRRNQSTQAATQNANMVPEPFPVPTEGSPATIAPRKIRADQQHIQNPFIQQFPDPPLTKWTRRNLSRGSPQRSSASPNHIIQEQGSSVSRLSSPLVPSEDSQIRPTGPETVTRRSVAQIDNVVPRMTSRNLELPSEGEREEDSGVRMAYVPFTMLPPEYTTH